MPAEVVNWHHQTAELDLRPAVLLGTVPLLELEEVIANVLSLALLDLDSDAVVGVVKVDAVIKPLVRPELAVRIVAAGGIPFVLVLREPVSDCGIEPPISVCFVEPSKTLIGTASTAARIDASDSPGNASDEV